MQIGMFESETEIESIFEGKTSEEINDWLKLRTANQIDFIFDRWADSITWTQLSLLDNQFKYRLIEKLVGNPAKMIPPRPRIFYVQPTEKAKKGREPVKVGMGLKNNVRRFKTISGPSSLTTEEAVYTANKYGAGAQNSRLRGYLEEIDAETFYLANKEAKETKKGNKK